MLSLDVGRSESATGVPPSEQLRRQVVEQVAAGTLVPGERLPSVRALATELGLAPGTVAKAYRELEAAGVVETRGRGGTVVSPTGGGTEQLAQRATLTYLAELDRLGLGTEEAVRLLRRLAPPRGRP